jgi:peptidoglycan-associated lipoprotein
MQTSKGEKMKKHLRLSVALVLIVSSIFLTTSCAPKKVTQAEPSSQPAPKASEVKPDKPPKNVELSAKLSEEDLLGQKSGAPAAAENEFDYENIYFAFDSSKLSNTARLKLSNNAKYLQKHANLTVTVEGHCDDRGPESYNIALGKRRAESVKKFLVDLGISTDRLVTVSYGENNPIAPGHDEASRAKNRRAQIMVNLIADNRKILKN